jgi:hypothetical protein
MMGVKEEKSFYPLFQYSITPTSGVPAGEGKRQEMQQVEA